MSGSLNNKFIRKLCYISKVVTRAAPRCCIEAGTYRGESTILLSENFNVVHTIELSEKWFLFSKNRLASHDNVTCHQGDSAAVIETLVHGITEPILYFLDAHFAGGDTAFGAEEVPLIRELEILHLRTEKDIIVIDDVRLIGKQGVCGSSGSAIYPKMNFDWQAVSFALIEESIGRDPSNPWWFRDDKIIIFRNLSYLQGCVIRMLLVLCEWRNFVVISLKKLSKRIHRALANGH